MKGVSEDHSEKWIFWLKTNSGEHLLKSVGCWDLHPEKQCQEKNLKRESSVCYSNWKKPGGIGNKRRVASHDGGWFTGIHVRFQQVHSSLLLDFLRPSHLLIQIWMHCCPKPSMPWTALFIPVFPITMFPSSTGCLDLWRLSDLSLGIYPQILQDCSNFNGKF